MDIIGIRRADGGENEEGKRFSLLMTLPQIDGEVPPFYECLYQTVRELCRRRGCTLRGEMVISYRDAVSYSLYLDFVWYRGRELLSCYRIALSRMADGTLLPPPKHLRKRIPKNGGWYRTKEDCVLFRNAFTAGEGIRRSAYRSRIPEEHYPWEEAAR